MLLAQLQAMTTALRWLASERFDHTTLVERGHGATVELVSDAQFLQAHALLARALPGTGEIGARYRDWRETQLIPPERLQASLELLSAEGRPPP